MRVNFIGRSGLGKLKVSRSKFMSKRNLGGKILMLGRGVRFGESFFEVIEAASGDGLGAFVELENLD